MSLVAQPSAEYIVLVDEHDTPVGTAEKLSSHHGQTPLHAAFSCYIFDDSGRFLVTERAHTKKVWPGVWTNSCCGHPAPGETREHAIVRRALFELGMQLTDIELIVPVYIYQTPLYKGVREHEYCPIYAARAASTVQPNPGEVAGYAWLSWSEYVQRISADAEQVYSWWAHDQMQYLQQPKAARALSRYTTST